VVGVGTQDGYAKAQAFVARHNLTFRMLWDRGFASWNAFGINGQPASILVSTDGRELKRWIGRLSDDDHAEALRLAAA
jgi:peroxiredoxin